MCTVHTEKKWEVSVQNWQRYGGNKCEILWNFEAFEYFILLSELCRDELQSNCYVFIFYVKVCFSARSICKNNERKQCIFHLFVSLFVNDSKWSRDLWCLTVLQLAEPNSISLIICQIIASGSRYIQHLWYYYSIYVLSYLMYFKSYPWASVMHRTSSAVVPTCGFFPRMQPSSFALRK